MIATSTSAPTMYLLPVSHDWESTFALRKSVEFSEAGLDFDFRPALSAAGTAPADAPAVALCPATAPDLTGTTAAVGTAATATKGMGTDFASLSVDRSIAPAGVSFAAIVPVVLSLLPPAGD